MPGQARIIKTAVLDKNVEIGEQKAKVFADNNNQRRLTLVEYNRTTTLDLKSDNIGGNSSKYPSFDKGEIRQNVLTKQIKPMFAHNSDLGFFQRLNFFCSVDQRRDFFQLRLDPYLTGQVSNLVMGLVFGGGQTLSNAFKSQVRVTGLSHVLSASGSNVSLVLLINSSFIRKKFGSSFTTFISIFAIIIYVSVAGCTAPLIRASITAVLALLGNSLWKRKLSQMWLLVITGAVMTFISADYLTDLSFQLSVAASLGLLSTPKLFPDKSREYLDVSISSLKRDCYHSNNMIANFTRVLSRGDQITKKLQRWVLVTVQTTLAIQLFTLPIVVLNFHELSILAVVSNVAVIWLVPFIVTVTLFTLLTSILHFSAFAFIFGQLTELFSTFFIHAITQMGSNSSFLLKLSDEQLIWFFLIYFICLLMLIGPNKVKKLTKIEEQRLMCH